MRAIGEEVGTAHRRGQAQGGSAQKGPSAKRAGRKPEGARLSTLGWESGPGSVPVLLLPSCVTSGKSHGISCLSCLICTAEMIVPALDAGVLEGIKEVKEEKNTREGPPCAQGAVPGHSPGSS